MRAWLRELCYFREDLRDVDWLFAVLGALALLGVWRHPRVTTLAWVALLVATGCVYHDALMGMVAIHDGVEPDPGQAATRVSAYASRALSVPIWCAIVGTPSLVGAALLALLRGGWRWRWELAVVPIVAGIPFAWEYYASWSPAADSAPWRAGAYVLGGLVLARASDDRRSLTASAWAVAVVLGELTTLSFAQYVGFHGPTGPAVFAERAAVATWDARLVGVSTVLAFVPVVAASGARAAPLLCAGLFAVLACDLGLVWRFVLWTAPAG